MIVASSFFALALSDTNWKIDTISTAEAQKIIAEKSQDAQFFVMRFHYHSAFQNSADYSDELWIRLQENGKFSKFIAPADKATLALLAEKGIQCPTYVQGRDFEIFGWQGKLLMGLFLFILAAGIAVFLTLWFKNKSNTPVMTKGTKIGILTAVVLAAIIVTPLVWLNHRKANSVQPNRMVPQTLTPERAAQAKQTARDFFEALGKADWSKVDKLCPPGFALSGQFDDQTKNMLNGLTLVSSGRTVHQAAVSWSLCALRNPVQERRVEKIQSGGAAGQSRTRMVLGRRPLKIHFKLAEYVRPVPPPDKSRFPRASDDNAASRRVRERSCASPSPRRFRE